MKIAIVINSTRLTPELKAILASGELTKKYNIEYDLFTPEPRELENTLKQLNFETYNACLLGGGDGTLRTGAKVLRHTQLPLAILPLGTFNVLAKSLNYPTDVDDIFNIIKNNKTKEIDLVTVNEEVFLNHSWLGFYPYIMKMREKHKTILGKSKLLKAAFNTFWMFKHIPIYQFQVKINTTVKNYKTCIIFISNNESSSTIFDFGERPFMSSGFLHVNILNFHTRWQLFIFILSILFGNLKKSKYLIQFSIDKLTVSSLHKETNIVLDGELLKITFPLHFNNIKNQLKIITT